MKKNNSKSKYFLTFFYTLIAVVFFFLLFLFLITAQIKNANKPEKFTPEETKKVQLLEESIKLEKQEIKNITQQPIPQKDDFRKLEKQYKKAITQTQGRLREPIEKLADLYLTHHKYEKAVTTIESVKYLSRRITLQMKCKFYQKYATLLFENKNYKEALTAYEKTIYYKKRLNKKIEIKEIKENLVKTYIALSQEAVNNGDTDNAINYIHNAMIYEKTPELFYNLAILYMNKDLKTSIDYFEIVRRKDPLIVNYELYFKALKSAQEMALEQKDDASAAIYATKYRMVKQFTKNIFLMPNEIKIVQDETQSKKKFFSGKINVNQKFMLKNIGDNNISHLYMNVEVFDNEVLIYQNYTKIIKDDEPLLEKCSKDIVVEFVVPKAKTHNVVCKIYLTKNKKVPMKEFISAKLNL